MLLAQKSRIAKLPSRRRCRARRLSTLLDQSVGQHLNVQLNLIFQIDYDTFSLNRCANFGCEHAKSIGHDHLPASSRSTRAITPEMRSQFSSSTASCFKPLLVIE